MWWFGRNEDAKQLMAIANRKPIDNHSMMINDWSIKGYS